MSTKSTKSGNIFNRWYSHQISKNSFNIRRQKISDKPIWQLLWRTIHYVISFFKFCKQDRDIFRRMLQILIHCDSYLITSRAYTAKRRILLAIIPHKSNALYPIVFFSKLLNHSPTAIRAAIVHKDNFILLCKCRQRFA